MFSWKIYRCFDKITVNLVVTFLVIVPSHQIDNTFRGIKIKGKNILMVIIDDLRHLPETSLVIPNLVDLAQKGVHFKNAYAQQALCAPSRNSLLMSRRPDSLHLYDFYSYWRDSAGNYTTLPQLFKQHGYKTYSLGKVFHPGESSNFTDDYPYSWTLPPFHPSTLRYKDAPVCPETSGKWGANLICPVDVKSQPEGALPDLQTLQRAIEILDEHDNTTPMFLAVGFYKPHIPLKCPKEYLDLYPPDSIKPPAQPDRPYSMPLVAWQPWTDVCKRDDIATLNISFPFGIMPSEWAKRIKRSYYSCVSYVDDLLGQLLRHVDMDNTIVVVFGDHGLSLGENGLWAKYSNYDAALKVPLIIQAPGFRNKEINEPVELIDIFPTLVDLVGLDVKIPKCSETSDKMLCFEGKTLFPFMNSESTHTMQHIALSQYPRPGVYPRRNSDKPRLKDIEIMGYSLRTARFRYTEWVKFNSSDFTANWSIVCGVELYDHSIDEHESLNLSDRSALSHIISHFASLLRKSFKGNV